MSTTAEPGRRRPCDRSALEDSVSTNRNKPYNKIAHTCPEMCTKERTSIHPHYRLIRLAPISIYKLCTSTLQALCKPACMCYSNYQKHVYITSYKKLHKMATTKRSHLSSGFYQLPNSLSSIDYDEDTPRKSTKLEIVDELPQGVYQVERLVAERKRVRHQTGSYR